ncbi:MAG: hypothetical protein HC858_08815, partial [Brachymonas sp.]|nr:hypothetical protein [Brachymonas sp.]
MQLSSFDFSQAPGYLIRRAHQTSMAIFSEELAAFDVTSLQFAIMQSLIDEPGADQISVAQKVALDAATSGSVIMRLEELRLAAARALQHGSPPQAALAHA